MEVKREVKTTQVDYICPNCETGELISTEESLLSTIPPRYPHKCNECKFTYVLDNKYPHYEYEIINL